MATRAPREPERPVSQRAASATPGQRYWKLDVNWKLTYRQHARLLHVVAQAGIGWTLARTWEGTRQRERQLKRQGGASRRCPICRAERKAGR